MLSSQVSTFILTLHFNLRRRQAPTSGSIRSTSLFLLPIRINPSIDRSRIIASCTSPLNITLSSRPPL
ncbi:uncharacterized protein FFM5_10735 [Fusarium fujikuroi]|nr:uncharacterized protein FFM5_10735 [Fusarium fujikuroi]